MPVPTLYRPGAPNPDAGRLADRQHGVAFAVRARSQSSSRAQSTRPRYPDREGALERDGVRLQWEGFGHGDPTLLFLPTWSIVHSRCTDTHSAILVALSLGAQRALILAADHPDRVRGLVLVCPALDLGDTLGAEREAPARFDTDLGVDDGWDRYNAHSWRRDYRGFLEFIFGQVFVEPHSTRQIEYCAEWGLDTDAETLITAEVAGLDATRVRELCARVRCPVLVVHGDCDAIIPHAIAAEAARITRGRLVTFAGSGHCPHARDPVQFNLVLRQFVTSLTQFEQRAER
jgi:pimeloyl-ACP methyl ester carboxylesterase